MLDLVDVRGGLLFLRDDRVGRRWHVDVPAFRLGRYPLTRDGLPLTGVSWYDAVALCNQLSEEAGLPVAYAIDGEQVEWDAASPGYRLPTEAEWQHACTCSGTCGSGAGISTTPRRTARTASSAAAASTTPPAPSAQRSDDAPTQPSPSKTSASA